MTTIPAYTAEQRVTQLRVLASEWTKLRSLPSTVWSLLTTLVLVVGFGAVYSMVLVKRPPADPSAFDAMGVSLAGVQMAQLAIGVAGVLLMTGEYATGSIRVSLTAVPKRLELLWGKAITFGLTALVLCVPAVFVAFVAGQSILSAENLEIGLGEPGVARAVVGSASYLAAVGLLGLGLGGMLRSTAGGISAVFGLLFAPQILVGFLPESLAAQVYRYVPAEAGQAVMYLKPNPDSLPPLAGLGVFCLYTAAVLALAAWQLRRRDV